MAQAASQHIAESPVRTVGSSLHVRIPCVGQPCLQWPAGVSYSFPPLSFPQGWRGRTLASGALCLGGFSPAQFWVWGWFWRDGGHEQGLNSPPPPSAAVLALVALPTSSSLWLVPLQFSTGNDSAIALDLESGIEISS